VREAEQRGRRQEAERREADGSRLRGMKQIIVAIILGASTARGGAEGPSVGAPEAAAAGEITPELLRAHVRFLASDLLEGRGPATRGDLLAEAYIQSQMEGMGLKPGAPGRAVSTRRSFLATACTKKAGLSPRLVRL
jgi:hypothetical protein